MILFTCGWVCLFAGFLGLFVFELPLDFCFDWVVLCCSVFIVGGLVDVLSLTCLCWELGY